MSFTKLKLNIPEVRRLRKSPAVAAELRRRGEKIRAAAGADDHEVQVFDGATRARVTVATSTWQGRYNEAKSQTLSRALDAGRG
jgi:hypothetical protein